MLDELFSLSSDEEDELELEDEDPGSRRLFTPRAFGAPFAWTWAEVKALTSEAAVALAFAFERRRSNLP